MPTGKGGNTPPEYFKTPGTDSSRSSQARSCLPDGYKRQTPKAMRDMDESKPGMPDGGVPAWAWA
ncbi:MAG: hypothetical protein ABIJ86_14085 [Spirochaetota bacterium]